MVIGIRNLEWRNHNEQRAYPLTADATAQDESASFILPEDFILDLKLAVHSGLSVDPAKFFIYKIGVYATGFSIVIGYQSSSGVKQVASALIARISHQPGTTYRLGGIGDFVDSTGMIIIGRLTSIDQQPSGQFTFALAGGRLEPHPISPYIRGVSSLQVQNGSDLSDRIYGDITLVAGANFRITPVLTGDDPVIVFDAIEGEGLNEQCVCEDDSSSEPIRTINGIPPTPAGDFTLLGSDCLQVNPVQNGVQLKDVCSQPCCGCQELETVTTALEQFGRQATTLENFLTSLESRVTQMDQVVLGAKLGDRGCSTC